MIFQHMLNQVLDGSKTQTRRTALPLSDGTDSFDCDLLAFPNGVKTAYRGKVGQTRWRVLWQVGKDYAVVPKRGQKQVARIRVLDLKHEDVRSISAEDAIAEGWLYNPIQQAYMVDPVLWYLRLWAILYDKAANVRMGQLNPDYWRAYLGARPQHYWLAWVITFELVKGGS